MTRGLAVHRARLAVVAVRAACTAAAWVATSLPRGPAMYAALLVAGAGAMGLFPCYDSLAQEVSPGNVGRWVEDNQWLLDLAERHAATLQDGMLGIVGVVGSLPLEDDASAPLIERFAKQRRFRGIRVNGDNLLEGLDDKGYAARLARLADHGLALDVNGGRVFDAVDAVAARFPDLRIVLNHMGNTPITGDGPLPEWRAALGRLARRPGVFMKVSALARKRRPLDET